MLIDRIWAEQPGKYFFLSTKSATGKFTDHAFSKSGDDDSLAFREMPQFLKDNSDKNIYFCAHGFNKPRRQKTYAEMPHLLWADLDEADPKSIKIKPTIAIESSPGRYVGLWFTDQPVTEELNRRMSYLVGADNSGWDVTQVLRVPGTTNYKYHAMPKVRMLWTDGPSYQVRRLEKELPHLDDGVGRDEESDAATLFKKHQRKMPQWLRRELLNGKPIDGKRSEVFWKLSQTLVEMGLPEDEIFTLIQASPWNKFAGRRNEDVQLQREIDKSINKRMKSTRPSDDGDGEKDHHRLIFRSMDEVEEEDIDWVWYPYMALGELSILEGDPGLGKSYLMQIISRMLCDGKRLPVQDPDKSVKPVCGKVLYFDIENSAGSVTKKRLTANGLINQENFVQCEEPFSIDDEDALDEIYEYVERVRPTLIVFDTLNTYLGGVDAFKGHDVAVTFGRFRELAKRFNCAVVVLRHLTKSTKERALYRGQGAIQLSGLARIVMTVGVSPEDADTRVMAVTKINVAKPPKALTFTIESLPHKGGDKDRSRFVWGDFVDLTADDIVAAPPKQASSDRDDAKAFLQASLADGPVEVNKLEKMAESRAINRRTLQRAADDLGVIKKTSGFGKDKRSNWHLPD